MNLVHRLVPLLGILLLLSGCLYDNPPSGPSASIDTWLVGQWQTQDKSGNEYQAVVSRPTSDHYHLSIRTGSNTPLEFDGWISKVDDFSILVVKSLNQDTSRGKYALYHYELLTPSPAPPGGIGSTRIRLSELQLDDACRTFDSYKLRASIRRGLKQGTLLTPYNVVDQRKFELLESQIISAESSIKADAADKKPITEERLASLKKLQEKAATLKHEILGSVIWYKNGGVTLKGETF